MGAFSGAMVAPMQLIMWPEAQVDGPAAALALAAWASWGALWFGLLGFIIVEIVGFFAPQIAVHKGFSVGLWRQLALAHAAVLAAVAFFNRDRVFQSLLGEYRAGLKGVGIAVCIFALVVLGLMVRRAPRRRSLLWACVASATLIAVAWGIWVAAPPLPGPPPRSQQFQFATGHRVVLVSWEGTDLPWILPAIERGDMPFLRTLRDEWAWGQLSTVSPHSRAGALATLATGCVASTHGVMGRRAYRLPWLTDTPVSLMLRGPWPPPHHLPWRMWDKAVPPPPRRGTVWEILVQAGRTVGLAGWPGVPTATWAIRTPLAAEALPYSAVDPELREALEPSLTAEPASAPQTRNAFAVSVETVALSALRFARDPVDCLMVNMDLAARLRPLWTEIDETAAQAEVLRHTARLLDEQLRDLWMLAGCEDCLLIVVSPYGMAPPKPWRRLLNALARRRSWSVSPADSPDGFILFAGPGVRKGVRLRSTRLTDVVPTVLYLMELPVARDMAGRVALDAVDEEFASRVPLRLIPSYPPAALHRSGPL
jgi:hypothetical protein